MGKIVVIVRTHNEQKNLNRFVLAYYDWVDRILVEDDESSNNTYLLDIKERYGDKVFVRYYNGQRVERNGVSRAIHHKQLNGLIEWAEECNTDWIIHDDCIIFT